MFLPAVPNFPESGIRLGDASFAQSDQVRNQRFMIPCSKIIKALVEKDRRESQQHLPVDIILHMLSRLIVAAYRSASQKASPVGMFGFREREVLAERVNRRKPIMCLLTGITDVQQKLQEPFHFLKMPQVVEGGERKMRVAQPAVAIVPVPRAAGLFRETGGQRRKDRSRVFVAVEFEGEGGANDFLLIEHRDRAMFHPDPPILRGLVQKFVADSNEVVFNSDSPRQRKVHFRGQRNRCFLTQVGEGHIRQEPQVLTTHFVPEVAIAANESHRRLVPARNRLATDANRRGAAERFYDPEEGGRSIDATILQKPWAKVGDLVRIPVRKGDGRDQDIGIREIVLLRGCFR